MLAEYSGVGSICRGIEQITFWESQNNGLDTKWHLSISLHRCCLTHRALSLLLTSADLVFSPTSCSAVTYLNAPSVQDKHVIHILHYSGYLCRHFWIFIASITGTPWPQSMPLRNGKQLLTLAFLSACPNLWGRCRHAITNTFRFPSLVANHPDSLRPKGVFCAVLFYVPKISILLGVNLLSNSIVEAPSPEWLWYFKALAHLCESN